MEKIELTAEELTEIKNDYAFRKMTTQSLKEMKEHMKESNGSLKDVILKVERLAVHSGIHWFLITGVLGGILMMAWKLFAK